MAEYDNRNSPLTPSSVRVGQLGVLETRYRMQNSRRDERIELTRQFLLGRLQIQLPEKLQKKLNTQMSPKEAEKFCVRLPQGSLVPLKTINVMQRKRPVARRQQIGFTATAQAAATKIAQWSNAVMCTQEEDMPYFDWDKAVELLFNEGECAVIVSPKSAHYEVLPSFETLVDSDKKIHKLYSRDDQGRKKTDRYYRKNKKVEYKENFDKSSEAYEEILEDWQARHLPWITRVIHATDTVPIWGPNDRLEALIVKQRYARDELIRRNFIWEGMDDLLTPVSDDGTSANGPEVTMREYWGKDKNGDYFVAYEIEGKPTKQKVAEDRQVDAVINLTEKYGIRRMPVTYKHGWHFNTKDPQDRGIPFIYFFIQSLLGVDILATATTFHTWWQAFGGLGYVPDKDLPAEAWLVGGKPREFDLEPMTVQAVPGPIQDFKGRGVGEDVHRLIALLASAVEQEIPGGGGQAFGAGSAESGRERSLMRNYLEDSISQVLKAAKELYKFVAEVTLEYACHLAEEEEMPIPVYEVERHGIHGKTEAPITKQIIELEPGDAGIVYTLEAEYPVKFGEYLAMSAHLAELVEKELATFEEYREMVFGDVAPEETRIAIVVDKLLFQSPIGQEFVMKLALEYLGEDRMAEMVELQRQNMMTQGGTPVAMMSGVFPGTPSPTPQQMAGVQSGAGQAVGGTVSGDTGTNAAMMESAARMANSSGGEGL